MLCLRALLQDDFLISNFPTSNHLTSNHFISNHSMSNHYSEAWNEREGERSSRDDHISKGNSLTHEHERGFGLVVD